MRRAFVAMMVVMLMAGSAYATHPRLQYYAELPAGDGYVVLAVDQWVPLHEPVDWTLCAVDKGTTEGCFPDLVPVAQCLGSHATHCVTGATLQTWTESNGLAGLQRTATCPMGAWEGSRCSDGSQPRPPDTLDREVESP